MMITLRKKEKNSGSDVPGFQILRILQWLQQTRFRTVVVISKADRNVFNIFNGLLIIAISMENRENVMNDEETGII